jgi:hypothetical protein
MASTATVSQMIEPREAAEPRDCMWLRLFCTECGQYDLAIPEDKLTPSHFEKCHWCGRDGLLVSDLAKGVTSRSMPYCSEPRKQGPRGPKRPKRQRGGRRPRA